MTRPHEHADNLTRELARNRGQSVNLPAAFYAWCGSIPRNVSPANYSKAHQVVRMLKMAKHMCSGDMALTRSEHTRLGRLITKWERRASGQDPWFNVMGTKPGRPTKEQEARLKKAGWTSSHTPVKTQKVYNKRCVECHSPFESHRSDRKYCQPLCRGRRFERLKRKQPHPWREEQND
jgi:hypothetical protein